MKRRRDRQNHGALRPKLGRDLDRGAGYGNTLTWTEKDKPKLDIQPVEIQVDLDTAKFYRMFVTLMSASPPPAR